MGFRTREHMRSQFPDHIYGTNIKKSGTLTIFNSVKRLFVEACTKNELFDAPLNSISGFYGALEMFNIIINII